MKGILFCFYVALFGACASSNSVVSDRMLPYDFSKTKERIVLPAILDEISGIAILDSNTLLCVQDEDGIIFQYDIPGKIITHSYPFGEKGDYEGITLKGDTAYVLRSDGVVFEVINFAGEQRQVTGYNTNIAAKNSEGMCYDKTNQRFLITPKGKAGKGAEAKDLRNIYSMDLKTMTVDPNPVISIDIKDIRQYALEHNLDVPLRKKKKSPQGEPIIHFRISSLEMHPLTNQLYALSDVDNMIFVFNTKGKLEYAEVLDEDDFAKAEGISFFPNGDLLISNEGNGKQPTLLRFNYRKL